MSETGSSSSSPTVAYWLGRIDGAKKWHQQWHEDGRKVIERYLDQWTDAPLAKNRGMRMNLLWSNVQTLTPALYAHTATPAVQRRFRDRDPVGRWAATVLERVESYELDTYDDDYNYRLAINDYLLPGRGQVWVYYEPTFGTDETTQQETINWECCKVRHINWKDFLTNPARSWDEVTWIAKREFLTKEEAKAQKLDVSELTFSEQEITGTNQPASDSALNQDETPKATVWEIWSKPHNQVFFVSPNSPKFLRKPAAPGFKFESFFPCPRPLTATTATDSILPRPDYNLYEDQAKEVDRMTQRINLLTNALRVAGVYDGSQESLSRLLENTDQNIMIPCMTYAVLASQGGVEGSVSFFPIQQIIGALKQCYESRDQAIQAMYQINGISDIVRGVTDPRETMGAQQIKSQWGGLRINDRQREIQRFIRDVFRLKSEVHAMQFQPATLKAMSNVPLADMQTKAQLQQKAQMAAQAQQLVQQNPQLAQQLVQQNPQLAQLAQPLTEQEQMLLEEPAWEQVVALLRNDKMRGFAVDVETDSTIAVDETQEKQNRTEFIDSMTKFILAWGPVVQAQPKMMPLAMGLLEFGARGFKTADSLMTVIEEVGDSLEQGLTPQPQDGAKAAAEMAKVQAEKVKLQATTVKAQAEQQKAVTDAQASAADSQAKIQIANMNAAQQQEAMQFERERQGLKTYEQIASMLKPPAGQA